MTEPELCEFIILFQVLIIDWLLMFVNQTQEGADLKSTFCCNASLNMNKKESTWK